MLFFVILLNGTMATLNRLTDVAREALSVLPRSSVTQSDKSVYYLSDWSAECQNGVKAFYFCWYIRKVLLNLIIQQLVHSNLIGQRDIP